MKWLGGRTRDERGALIILVSISMVVVIASAALAVDIGRVTNNNRDLQDVADVVALDSARALNGTTVGVLSAPTGAVTIAAQNSAARNNFPFNQLQVQLGTKVANAPFVQMTNAGDVPNAVRIIASGNIAYAFRPGNKTTSRRAVATQSGEAGFSAGSYLVGIADEHDTVLNGIFGDSFGAHVLSYNGLANANVTLEAIGLEWPTGVLTPDQVLTSNLTLNNFLLASADVMRNQGDTAAANILDAFRLSMTSNTNINLADIIEAETGGSQAAASAELNLMQMLTAMAFVADGTHAINIPAAQLSIPGIGGVTVALDVIEPAKIYIGPAHVAGSPPHITTAQAHLTLTPQINISTSTTSTNACTLTGGLIALLGLVVSCLLGPVGKIINLNLNASIPIALEAGGAAANLEAVNCDPPKSITVGLDTLPLTLTSNVDLNFTGAIGPISLGSVLRVQATGGVTAQSTVADQVFHYPSEFGPPPRSVGSTTLGLAGLTNFTATNVSLLNVGLTSALNVLSAAVLPLVNTTLGALDSLLVNPLNKLLGLSMGGADLTALENSMKCNGVRLAE